MDDVSSHGYISKGAVYRRDKGYEYEGTGELPIAAYDISDPDNPRRLNICFVEDDNQEGVTANLIWDMGWTGSEFPGDRGGPRIPVYNGHKIMMRVLIIMHRMTVPIMT